jgi:hypothetical protein
MYFRSGRVMAHPSLMHTSQTKAAYIPAGRQPPPSCPVGREPHPTAAVERSLYEELDLVSATSDKLTRNLDDERRSTKTAFSSRIDDDRPTMPFDNFLGDP